MKPLEPLYKNLRNKVDNALYDVVDTLWNDIQHFQPNEFDIVGSISTRTQCIKEHLDQLKLYENDPFYQIVKIMLPPLPEAITENGDPTLATSKSPLLDLFYHLTRSVVENKEYYRWIEAAWHENPLDTMRIIFQGRDCRGGKGDRAPFFMAMEWVAIHHPEWFSANFRHIPEYGRWLDVIEIMTRVPSAIKREIATFVCEQLRADIQAMQKGTSVSLLAKWLPSEGKSKDRDHGLVAYLCSLLFPEEINAKKRAYLYRKEYLTPLRAYIRIVEIYMCDGRWEEIDYSKVPSVAMKRLRNVFCKHDQERFNAWIELVKEGKSKIQSTQVYPHDLVMNYKKYDEVIELQWKGIVESVKSLGVFDRALVISDVSASMSGIPMEVSVSLGILIASLSQPPFQNQMITFTESPKWFSLKGNTLLDQVAHVRSMPWGANTNLDAVFDMILEKAIQSALSSEEMPTTLYILSDMQFDQAAGNFSQHTAFERIQGKYRKAGYTMPRIIFWNLRSNTTSTIPVSKSEKNVALLSGYSPALLKSILRGVSIDPMSMLRQIIDDPRYARIQPPVGR